MADVIQIEMNFEVKRLSPNDDQLAIEAIIKLKINVEGKSRYPSSIHILELLHNPCNYLILGLINDEPVGFLIAHKFPRIDRDKYMVYLYEIGVDEKHRRKGIGKSMIQLMKDIGKNENIMEIWVGTGHNNIEAQKLYESTGAKLDGDHNFEYVYEL